MKISDAKAVLWLVHQARMVSMSGKTFERIDAEFLEAVKEPPPVFYAHGSSRPTEESCELLAVIKQRDALQKRLDEAEAALANANTSRSNALEARDVTQRMHNTITAARDDALRWVAELQKRLDLALEREANVSRDSINAEGRAARLRSALLDLVQHFEQQYGVHQPSESPIGRARRILEKNS